MTDFERMLDGYRLTTAEILYHLPDHPGLLQTYLWQQYDLAPKFPELRKFLDFWEARIDGKLHSVTIASNRMVRPAEFRYMGQQLTIH